MGSSGAIQVASGPTLDHLPLLPSRHAMSLMWVYPDNYTFQAALPAATAKERLVGVPFSTGVIENFNISEIAVDVVTAEVDSVVRLGIYAAPQATLIANPTLIVDAGTVDTSTTGIKSKELAEVLPLVVSTTYWLVAVAQGTGDAPELRGYNGPPAVSQDFLTPTPEVMNGIAFEDAVAGALVDAPGFDDPIHSPAPIIALRIAD